ncbi:MAG: hypothetical protein LBS27_05440 [Bifidobacteriaceae bacterium]|nr:hypothetical protein [Bifidobacteriaceae bacterium]
MTGKTIEIGGAVRRIREFSKSEARGEGGSAVIEATIAFTAFAMVIVIVYSVINFCVAEARVRFAVDATAKELSTYGYLMRMAGLDQAATGMAQDAQNTQNTIESVTTNFENMMAGYNELNGALQSGNIGAVDPSNLIDAIRAGGDAVDEIREVAGDPTAFVMGLAALVARDGLDWAASQMVGALVEKQLRGEEGIDVNAYLSGLGVVDGFDGITFYTPNFLGPVLDGEASDSWNITIQACYDVEVENFLNLDTKVHVCSTGSTRAWMGDQAGQGG